MKFNTFARAGMIVLGLTGAQSALAQVPVQHTVKKVEGLLGGAEEGYKIGDAITLYTDVRNKALLLDQELIEQYHRLRLSHNAKELQMYVFPQGMSKTKKGVGYVVKIDFVQENGVTPSYFYFVASGGKVMKLSSESFEGALRETQLL